MNPTLRTAGRWTIIVLAVLHMAAVLLYSIPWAANDAPTRWVRINVSAKVHPYILATSQWQQWNLFSPDPLRRVSHYVVQYKHEKAWITLRHYKPGMYEWWRHSNRFKLLGEFLDNQGEGYHPFAHHLLHRLCAGEKLQPGTQIRLFRSSYVIPMHLKPESAAWWKGWKPEFMELTPIDTTCPDAQTMSTLTPFK